ncbi:MAG: MTAP family purine nucleoside phosphorylase, partial [Planctomycetes bacterium]|nr:MTAP family purine nucleoside phosphorylase [Planctomycetota bacterium]
GDKERVQVETEFGTVKLVKSEKYIFCQRHGLDKADYVPPHSINHQANLKALASFNPTAIVGFTSVGSLKVELTPGTVMIPDDYFSPFVNKTFFDKLNPRAITPGFDDKLQNWLSDLLKNNDIEHVNSGSYALMQGPRFETCSEIKFLRQYAEVVGMTAAHEATLAKELDIPYALISMIDNYANGVADKPLSFADFEKGVAENFTKVMMIFNLIIKNFCAYVQ